MSIKVYNTLTRRKEEFRPIIENEVKMYACGITVYNDCHIGHARQAIVYDVICKYLKYRGFNVTYVRNYTDVDDKIIARANELNMNALEYSNDRIKDAETDLAKIGVDAADISPKVSEHINIIIDFIDGLIEKGYAYSTNKGDVYFSVKKFNGYGKLSNRNVDELEHGVRNEVGEDKEHPLDFALWKSAKEGEIFWNSPWGQGRPGWHIECSAMSIKHLGETFDIHGGGGDLIFPHHENEIAQSEALTGKTFANYWIHNGLVTIDGQKMSKSLGNTITIKEVIKKYHPEVIHFSMLLNHYSSAIDLGYEIFDAAEKRLYYLYRTLEKVDEFIQDNSFKKAQKANLDIIDKIEADFVDAMDDDFNTALAISNLSDIFKHMNDLLKKSSNNELAVSILLGLKEEILKVTKPLGILSEVPAKFTKFTREKFIKNRNINVDKVNDLVSTRIIAKNNKDYTLADSIRNELSEIGIIIQDTSEGTQWDIKDLY